jgi:hypothetical protein
MNKETTWCREQRLKAELEAENARLWDCLDGLRSNLSCAYIKGQLCYGHKTILGEAPAKGLHAVGVGYEARGNET